jgi:hypothetical protein
MRMHHPRFTLLETMAIVVPIALMLTFLKSTNDPLWFYLADRGRLPGPAIFALLVFLVAVIATAPFFMAVRTMLRAKTGGGGERRRTIRSAIVAIAWIVVGVGLANWPWDGMRLAWRLKDGSYVMFYHQFRVWPGREVTPCLELASPTGKTLRIYAIADKISHLSSPDLRMNGDQTEIWLVEGNAKQKRPDHVFCSLNRQTGRFVRLGGTHPPGISVTTGF